MAEQSRGNRTPTILLDDGCLILEGAILLGSGRLQLSSSSPGPPAWSLLPALLPPQSRPPTICRCNLAGPVGYFRLTRPTAFSLSYSCTLVKFSLALAHVLALVLAPAPSFPFPPPKNLPSRKETRARDRKAHGSCAISHALFLHAICALASSISPTTPVSKNSGAGAFPSSSFPLPSYQNPPHLDFAWLRLSLVLHYTTPLLPYYHQLIHKHLIDFSLFVNHSFILDLETCHFAPTSIFVAPFSSRRSQTLETCHES